LRGVQRQIRMESYSQQLVHIASVPMRSSRYPRSKILARSGDQPRGLMKFLCTLPEQKHYQPVQSTTPGKFIWVDKASPCLRIIASIPNPWETNLVIMPSIEKAKNDTYQYPSRLSLKCFLEETNANTLQGIVVREIVRGKFVHSINSPVQFFCFPKEGDEKSFIHSKDQQWLVYSFYNQ
jgi:hypothetical protein